MRFATKPSRREMIWGCIYLVLFLTVLPRLIPAAALILLPRLNAAQVNFIFFMVNFTATAVIFRKFILQSLKDAVSVPASTIWCAILGYLGDLTLGSLVAGLIYRLEPDFANVNDMAVNAIVAENFGLMAVGVVVLGPIAEELLFRGLIFRGLYDRSPLLAHLVSIGLFSLIHVTNYIGVYDLRLLILCFIQYIPAAYCLNFAYRRSGTIAAPILTHMLVNLAALSAMR